MNPSVDENAVRTVDGLSLRFYDWSVASPQASAGIVHGYCEHAGRYGHVARALGVCPRIQILERFATWFLQRAAQVASTAKPGARRE